MPPSSPSSRLAWLSRLPAVLAVGALAGLAALGDLAQAPGAAAALVAVALLAMAWASRAGVSVRSVVVVAVLQRALAVSLEPTLSDDVWRYLWEGEVARHAISPWHHAPDDPSIEGLRTPSWKRVAHRDVPSIYPPLSVATFSIAAATGQPLLAWKLLLMAADLSVCWLIAALLRRRGLPSGRVLWYAWNPLPILEGPGMGHLDAIGIALVLAGLLALESRPEQSRRAGLLLALGALAKIAPLAALPFWVRGSQRPRRLLGVALLAGALGSIPMWLSGPPAAVGRYAVDWEFDGPLYEPGWRLVAATGLAPAIHSGFDSIEKTLARHDLLDPLYPWVYPQLLTKILLLLGAGVAALGLWRCHDALLVTGRLFGILLLCSATLYPWYLLWVLPFAAISERRGWLLASATSWVSYGAQLGLASLWPWLWALQWLPPLTLRLGERRWSSTH